MERIQATRSNSSSLVPGEHTLVASVQPLWCQQATQYQSFASYPHDLNQVEALVSAGERWVDLGAIVSDHSLWTGLEEVPTIHGRGRDGRGRVKPDLLRAKGPDGFVSAYNKIGEAMARAGYQEGEFFEGRQRKFWRFFQL
jgi:hypothetical protein